MKKNSLSLPMRLHHRGDGEVRGMFTWGITETHMERGNWSNKAEYLLSMIGYAVGLGNVWRFPYLAYKNGGGAFLIPYSIMLAFTGVPLFLLECSLGQFASLGPTGVWKAVPVLKGVGYTMIAEVTFLCIYYTCIIGYGFFYLFASFQTPLPWADCFSWWKPDESCSKLTKGCQTNPVDICFDVIPQIDTVKSFDRVYLDYQKTFGRCICKMRLLGMKDPLCNFTRADGSFKIVNLTHLQEKNETCLNGTLIHVFQQSPSEQYWDKVALRRSDSISETGEVVWYLALSLLLAWIIITLSLSRGIQSSGKVVYFTAIFPYVVLTILLIRGLTLEGADKGIAYYIGRESDISKLANAEVWKDAATQIFFSLSVAWGGLTTLSSYNKFNNNCYADTFIICSINCLTSVFSGFAIFSILGHMAHIQGVPVSEVAQSGFGLVFIAYPEALAELPGAPFWSILFFFMLVTLGLDSIFASVETITTSLQDEFPILRSKRLHLAVCCCGSIFLLGLLCVTRAGIYWVNLLDHFIAGWTILIIGIMEFIGIIWIYGGNQFIKDIEMMIGERSWYTWIWWKACWYFISPILLIGILIWSIIIFDPPTYGDIEYPVWAIALGWCMLLCCIIWIPIVAIVVIAKSKGTTLWEKIKTSFRPAPDWGPHLDNMPSISKQPVNTVQLSAVNDSEKL